MNQNEAFVLGATVVTLGTLGASTFPTRIQPPPSCIGLQMKLMGAAGSTVQILPNYISGQTVSGATAAIAGYPLVTTEMQPIYGPANFYLAATGATATVAILFKLTAGATLV